MARLQTDMLSPTSRLTNVVSTQQWDVLVCYSLDCFLHSLRGPASVETTVLPQAVCVLLLKWVSLFSKGTRGNGQVPQMWSGRERVGTGTGNLRGCV